MTLLASRSLSSLIIVDAAALPPTICRRFRFLLRMRLASASACKANSATRYLIIFFLIKLSNYETIATATHRMLRRHSSRLLIWASAIGLVYCLNEEAQTTRNNSIQQTKCWHHCSSLTETPLPPTARVHCISFCCFCKLSQRSVKQHSYTQLALYGSLVQRGWIGCVCRCRIH